LREQLLEHFDVKEGFISPTGLCVVGDEHWAFFEDGGVKVGRRHWGDEPGKEGIFDRYD
jgi:hypothetical protein